MKYRIACNGDRYRIYRKSFLFWVPLDHCNCWKSYGYRFPKLFDSVEAAIAFTKKWSVIKEFDQSFIDGLQQKKHDDAVKFMDRVMGLMSHSFTGKPFMAALEALVDEYKAQQKNTVV